MRGIVRSSVIVHNFAVFASPFSIVFAWGLDTAVADRRPFHRPEAQYYIDVSDHRKPVVIIIVLYE